MKNIIIEISFTFFAVIGILTIWDTSWGFKVIIALFCCILHECGHILTMCRYGIAPEKIIFYGGGIKIVPCKDKMISQWQYVLVLISGCLVNILIAVVIRFITGEFNYFAYANMFLGVFNLLPFKYFDGGRILAEIFNDGKICSIVKIIFIILFIIVLYKMIITGNTSISLIITFIYIILSEILA